MGFKKEIYQGVEYHFPDTFASAEDYLGSLGDTVVSPSIELEMQWEQVRLKRDRLIASTDWTQMTDAPLDDAKKAEFTAYRQALRDIPQNSSDPDAVVWPEKPTV
ncbi:tail fiber assembly protein [Vibrio vulnificus]|uniref:tail fiber assembly protein n=1 Tax=Vibrio vulnificus TaxID=672 RepID=UPI00311AA680